MSAHFQRVEDLDRHVKDWLFLLLRFAITRDANDRAAVMQTAAVLDALARGDPSPFGFFTRTSDQVCEAISQCQNEVARQTLRKHAASIDDPRLRAAFLASLGLDDPPAQRQHRRRAQWRERDDLWRGLPKRSSQRGR